MEKRSHSDALAVAVILSSLFMIFIFFAVIFAFSEMSVKNIENKTDEVREYNRKHNNSKMYKDSLYDVIVWNKENFAYEEYDELTDDAYDYFDEDTYVFDDYITTDVCYRILYDKWVYNNTDGLYDGEEVMFPDDIVGYGEYIKLTGTGLENENELNELLFDKSVMGMDTWFWEDMEFSDDQIVLLEGYPYVSYMDDGVLSVIFEYIGWLIDDYGEDDEESTYVFGCLDSVNIDMTTGEIIDVMDKVSVDEGFVDFFVRESDEQNGTEFNNSESKELILDTFSNNGVVAFYTPLGVEYGYSTSNNMGYFTITVPSEEMNGGF